MKTKAMAAILALAIYGPAAQELGGAYTAPSDNGRST